MSWDMEDAISYYQRQGAPGDQNMMIALLREIQEEAGGSIPPAALTSIARAYGVKDSLLTALIRRIPSLRLSDTHCLELCGGPNCGRHSQLAALAQQLQAAAPGKFTLKRVPCMRMCGKGPNLRWDGTLYHQADEALLRRLTEGL